MSAHDVPEFNISKGTQELLMVAQKFPNDVILIDFHAHWCGPCKRIAPKLHNMVKKHAAERRRLILCKVDVDEPNNQDAVKAYGVSSMPTLVWIWDMNVVARVEGADETKITKTTENLLSQ